MNALKTQYMGLELPSPIVVSSCGLSRKLDNLIQMEKNGAGAVVLKSLFEEQFSAEARTMQQGDLSWHTEAYDYVHRMSMEVGMDSMVKLIKEARRKLTIPVIASINCVSSPWWVDYATRLARAGASGLELNISYLPSRPDITGRQVKEGVLEIVRSVRSRVVCPLAVKISPYYSSLLSLALALEREGASALVMFNRFHQVDIDIENLKLVSAYHFSRPEEISLPLRWIALLSGSLEIDLAGGTGVHDGTGVVKMLLAGATVVQMCSALYQHGIERIGECLDFLSHWMEKHAFTRLEDFRGQLRKKPGNESELWDRLQYIKALVGIE